MTFILTNLTNKKDQPKTELPLATPRPAAKEPSKGQKEHPSKGFRQEGQENHPCHWPTPGPGLPIVLDRPRTLALSPKRLHGRVTKLVVPEQVLYWVGGGGGEECGKEAESCWPFAVKYSKTKRKKSTGLKSGGYFSLLQKSKHCFEKQ